MVDEIELSVEGEIAFVRFRRPNDGNTLRGPMFDTLRKFGVRLADAPPRFVVLTSEGPDFCAGLSLAEGDPLRQVVDGLVRARDTHGAAELVRRMRSSFEVFGRIPCPVIAAIEGRCHGAGLDFATVADLRVASESATFAVDDGLERRFPGLGGLARLGGAIGTGRAAHLALTGRTMSATEAGAVGLVQVVTPAGGALSGAVDLIHEIRRTGPTARLQSLLALRASTRVSAEAQDLEVQGAARTWMSAEYQVTGDGAT